MQISIAGIQGPINVLCDGPFEIRHAGEELYYITSKDMNQEDGNCLESMNQNKIRLCFDGNLIQQIVTGLNQWWENIKASA